MNSYSNQYNYFNADNSNLSGIGLNFNSGEAIPIQDISIPVEEYVKIRMNQLNIDKLFKHGPEPLRGEITKKSYDSIKEIDYDNGFNVI